MRFLYYLRDPERTHIPNMKRLILFLSLAFIGVALPRAARAVDVSVDLFYDELEPYGDWVDAGDYGYAWHPRDVNPDWRPYTDGHWVYTDSGWTWVSEEPYSWAVYHYGRWAEVNDVGWIWVPGREWGPAWVSFRRDKHHVGWAPLPPEAHFGHGVHSISSWSDSYYDVGPQAYSFVEVRNFGAPHIREFVVPAQQNVTIINQTTNITNIRVQNNVVYNGGPEYDVIRRETAQPIQRLRIDRRNDYAAGNRDSFQSHVQGDQLRIAAPRFAAAAPDAAPKKVSRKLENVQVNRGWKGVPDDAETKQLRAKMHAAKAPAGLPPQPKFEKASLLADPETAPEAAGKKGKGGKGEAVVPAADATNPTTADQPDAKGGKGKNGKMKGDKVSPSDAPDTAPADATAPDSKEPGKMNKKGKKGADAVVPEAAVKPEPKHDATPNDAGTPPEGTGSKGKKGKMEQPSSKGEHKAKNDSANEPPPAPMPTREARPEKSAKQDRPDPAPEPQQHEQKKNHQPEPQKHERAPEQPQPQKHEKAQAPEQPKQQKHEKAAPQQPQGGGGGQPQAAAPQGGGGGQPQAEEKGGKGKGKGKKDKEEKQ